MRGVWIADTLGEMGLWYRLAPIAFVGRSLTTPGGGQNLLEPALLRCAILVGPHTGNFEEHVRLLREADALAVVSDAAELARTVGELLLDYDRCNGMGERAAAAVQRERDLPARTATALRALLDGTA